jgi:hypothetical protein
MFSRLRKRFTYTNVAMTLALVFAMTGGAFAASKFVITSTKQISPKVLKSLKGSNGKSGANGAAGATGAAGASGPAGATGPGGPQGPQGVAGTNGGNGTNGTNGAKGATGAPWTAGGVLPSEQTEKGVWSALIVENFMHSKSGSSAISFVIPVSSAFSVEFINEGQAGIEHKAECPGTVEQPKAAAGFLCVYSASNGAAKFEEATAYESGAYVSFDEGTFIGVAANGTWAVTAK